MDENRRERYRLALSWVHYEGGLLWQIFGAFLLPHTVFLAFLLQAVLGAQLPANRPGGFWASLVGLVLCLPWWASYRRSSAYYEFRLAQAKQCEPQDWELLTGVGEQFAEGDRVEIEGQPYRQPWMSRLLRTGRSVSAMIIAFALIYAAIAAVSAPCW